MPRETRPLPGPATALALVAAAFGGLACAESPRGAGADLQVRWSFEPSPVRVGVAEIRLLVSDPDWSPRNGATVVLTGIREGVELVTDTARGQGAGLYTVPAFRFEVAGEWILRARVETPPRSWTEVERKVTVVAPSGGTP